MVLINKKLLDELTSQAKENTKMALKTDKVVNEGFDELISQMRKDIEHFGMDAHNNFEYASSRVQNYPTELNY